MAGKQKKGTRPFNFLSDFHPKMWSGYFDTSIFSMSWTYFLKSG